MCCACSAANRIRGKVEVHNAVGHRADGQPALITGRSKHSRQVRRGRNDDAKLIGTRPARFRYGSRVHIRPR